MLPTLTRSLVFVFGVVVFTAVGLSAIGSNRLVNIVAVEDFFGIGQSASPLLAGGPHGKKPTSLLASTTTLLTPFSISTETGEKPQSKVWFNDGHWWAVMPSTSVAPAGTWVWRLEPNNTWTNVLQISSATDTHADTKAVGNVTHILLEGASSSLVSVEYVPATTTYQLWPGRATSTPLSLPNHETASFDIDSTGRMWVATENGANINVYDSAFPYTSFAGPTTLANNVNDDDISAIIAMPGNKIGVLWSNQNTQRFGFKIHLDADPAGTWSADEVPASQSALNVGLGMADDHLNMKVASDGTIYAAVKTSYDTSGFPKIALLVRRPAGTWDNQYEVDQSGTRANLLLNETEGKIRVVYTSTEGFANIVYKETSTSAISFAGSAQSLMTGGLNNVTTAKSNWTGQIVILASSSTQASGVLIDDSGATPTPTPTATPTPTPTATPTPDASLIALWSMDEASGAVLNDTGALPANNANTTGAPVFGSGQIGNALSLNGSSQYAIAPDENSLDIQNAITMAAWIKPSKSSAATQNIIKKKTGTTSPADGYELSLSSTGKVFVRFNDGTVANGRRVDSATSYPLSGSAWMHVAATYDGASVKVYINGTLDASSSAAFTINSNATNVGIGAEPAATPINFFGGQLDDVRIYNRALSVAEIQSLANPTPTNSAPVVSAGADATVTLPASANLSGTASDDGLPAPPSLTTTWTKFGGPGTVTFGSSNALSTTASFSTSGVYVLRLTADDGSLQSFDDVQITVNPSGGPPSPVGYWPMDEGSGTQILDASGSGNNGNLNGNPTWSSDRIQGPFSLALDGTGDYAQVPDSASLDITNAITMAAWLKPSASTTQYLIKKAANGATDGFELGLSSSTAAVVQKPFVRFNQATSGDTFRVNGTTTYPSNGSTWIHVAATWNGSTTKIYVNGVLEASAAFAGPIVANNLPVGIGADSAGASAFNGKMDDVRVYGQALTASEIQALANSGPSGSPDQPVLNSPANGSTGISTSPTLDVSVSDPNGDPLTVTYFGRPLAVGNFSQIGESSGVPSLLASTISWNGLMSGQTYEWYVTVSDGVNTTTGPIWTFHTAASADPVFVGAGDIASCSVTEDTATGNILLGVDGTVFTTGDNVYTTGTAAEFTNCYATTPWGDASVKGRTRPVPGNHDWGNGSNNNLAGYFGYYGSNATDANGKSYYSYDIPSSNWHIVNLDSECQFVVGGCSAGSAQELWLKADLAANSTKNVIALWHKPRYSSGSTKFTDIQPLWNDLYAAGVDIILVGHDHVYERFAPMKSGANLSDPPIADPTYGMTQFTVGTGGEAHHSFGPTLPTSLVRDGTTFGVLKLTLHNSSYDWVFLPIAGSTFTDSGTANVHGAPAGPNNIPVITEGASTGVTMSEDGAPTPFSLTLHATDADASDTLSWSVTSPASHGTAVATGTGASVPVTYTPTANFSGSDSFVVQVSDGNGGTDTITVNVTIDPVNDAPTITGQSTLTTSKNTALTIVFNDLTVTDVDNSYPTGFSLTVLDGTNYTHSGNTITPASNFVGTLTVPVKVNDGLADSNVFDLSVSVTEGIVYYVDNTNASCSDTINDGLTPAAPFCTITKGANIAVAGNTVRVLAGTYSETVNPANNGTSGNPITFSAASGVSVTGNGTATGNAFRMSGKSYIVIDGFTVVNTVDYGIYASGSNHITVSNNDVSSAGSPASGATRAGIYFTNTDDSIISGNSSHHNSQDGIRLTGGSSGNLVVSNSAFGNAEEWERNATGIQVTGVGSDNNVVTHNYAYGNEDSGIQFYAGAQNNVVVGNLSFGNGDHGIDCNFAAGNTIVGNTVHGNVTVGINLEGAVGQGSGNATLANNIAMDNGLLLLVGGGTASGQAGNIRVDAQSVAGTTMDYDLVFRSSVGTTIQWNGVSYTSLAAFKAVVPGQETHGIEANPSFAAAAPVAQRPAAAPFNVTVNNGNYHLLSGSPAIDSANAGAPSEPATDLDGFARIDDPSTADSGTGIRTFDDRGAYEYQPLGTTAAPASISGRVRTASGIGIREAVITVWGGGLDQPVYVKTNSFGKWAVGGLPVGYTYLVMVSSRRYAFDQPVRSLNLTAEAANFDFVAEDQ